MRKEILSEYEPLVYQALENACRSKRVSHAYLFTGPKGTPKKEAAILLAQSLFCEHGDGLACEECNTCQRVADGNHLDFVILDGSEKAIGKKDIDALQDKFARTSSESGTGQRCYIILNAENSSIAAMNSMLKFLEEPGKDITAILTADNENRLLPTIISRCTRIPFTKVPVEKFYEKAKQEGINDIDAYYVSAIADALDTLQDIYDSEAYKNAMMMVEQFLHGDHQELLVDYEISYKCSDKEENRKMVMYFLTLLDLFGHDVILQNKKGYPWYQELVVKYQGQQDLFGQWICLLNAQKDLCNKFNDIHLLMAQTFERLEELRSVLQ